MQISPDVIRGHTDSIILSRLITGDSYGYDIGKSIRRLSDGYIDLKEATLYTAFRRMEVDGLIISYWGEQEGGARRRYYRITEKGRKAYCAYIEEWKSTKTILDRIFMIGGNQNA